MYLSLYIYIYIYIVCVYLSLFVPLVAMLFARLLQLRGGAQRVDVLAAELLPDLVAR